MNFELTYGTQKVGFEIDRRHLPHELPYIAPREVDTTGGTDNLEERINRALTNPLGSPRLKDLVAGKRIALIVSDEFRSGQQELIIKCLMAEIAQGDPAEAWTFCATGSHDPKIYAQRIGEWAEKYAHANSLTHRFFANDCTADTYVNLGHGSDGLPIEIHRELIKCEVRAYGHEGKHHYMNGYSCIDKQLLPGLSSARSIALHHKHALNDKLSFGGRSVWVDDPERTINPFSLSCFEARRLADSTRIDKDGGLQRGNVATFGLDMISDPKRIYWTAAGNIAEISLQMTREVDLRATFMVEPTRYLIISPGGPPASQTVYSVQNCFDMAISGAIQDGGEVLVLAPCDGRPDVPQETRGLAPDGKSKKLFYDNLARMKSWPIEESSKWIAENFQLYLWKTDRVLKLMNKRKIRFYLHSTLPDDKVGAIGFIPTENIQAWIDERASKNNSPIRIVDHGNKILIMKK